MVVGVVFIGVVRGKLTNENVLGNLRERIWLVNRKM